MPAQRSPGPPAPPPGGGVGPDASSLGRREGSLGADLLLGAGLCLLCLVALLFATGEDTSFIYIDF